MKNWTATGVPLWEAKNLIRHTPPESVPITFRLSSIGARFGAQMLDLAFTYGGVNLLLIAAGWLASVSVPPRLTASLAILSASRKAKASASPPFR
mgnify:CR=1 FL=1